MMLETGYKHGFEVRAENMTAPVAESFTVAYLSDFHLNRYSGPIIQMIIRAINTLNPDIILLGGDYVDSKKGFYYLDLLGQALSHRKHVFAIAGNHDYFYGIKEVKRIFNDHHINWIEKETACLEIKSARISIDGNKPDALKKETDFSILCLHKPINISGYQHCYNLVLAGHLHGSQFVFWKQGAALYPGRIFYRWNILNKTFGACQYLISKGLGDTLPIRYNCKKDIIFVTVSSQNPISESINTIIL